MTAQEKATFIDELFASYRATILGAIKKMPEEWNGIELRQFVADLAAANIMCMTPERLASYRNTVTVEGLPCA